MAKSYVTLETLPNMLGELGSMDIGVMGGLTNNQFSVGYNGVGTCVIVPGSYTIQRAGDDAAATFEFKNGHKYYCSLFAREEFLASGRPSSLNVTAGSMTLMSYETGFLSWSNEWLKCSGISDYSDESKDCEIVLDFGYYTAKNVYVDNMTIVDLTAAFGSGNEPDQAWCDANIIFTTSAEGKSLANIRKMYYVTPDKEAKMIKKAYYIEKDTNEQLHARLVFAPFSRWARYNAGYSSHDEYSRLEVGEEVARLVLENVTPDYTISATNFFYFDKYKGFYVDEEKHPYREDAIANYYNKANGGGFAVSDTAVFEYSVVENSAVSYNLYQTVIASAAKYEIISYYHTDIESIISVPSDNQPFDASKEKIVESDSSTAFYTFNNEDNKYYYYSLQE